MSAGFLLTRISKRSSSSENGTSVRAARSCVPCLGPAYHFAILTAGDRFLAFMSAGFLPSRISKRSSSSETATSVCAARSCVSCLGPAYHFVNPTAGDRFLAFMSAGFLPSRISKRSYPSENCTSVRAARSCVPCLGPAYHFVNPDIPKRLSAKLFLKRRKA